MSAKPLGGAALDLVERVLPRLDVDSGGGVGGMTKRPGRTRTPHASPA
jgi:hypothetical protein